VTLLGEAPDVIPQGFSLLLSATLQISGIVGLHICALKVLCEYLLEILPTIDRVIKPSLGRISQIDGEELDDEEVIIHPTRPAREAVVAQPDTGIGLAVILDDVVGHTEMPREARITHVADCYAHHDRLCARCSVHAPSSPREPDGMPEAWGIHSGGPAGDGMGTALLKMRFPSWSFIGSP
jgi:hypothetical protein